MRTKQALLAAVSVLVIAAILVFARPVEGIVITGHFIDDNGHLFEADIDTIAAADITRGCNPPENTRFCPNQRVTRGEMAAFLRRALDLPSSSTNPFVDGAGHLFEADINAIAAADITRGCNPPANDRFCPDEQVTRDQMAAFLRRAFELDPPSSGAFVDIAGSIFAADINAIAAADITRGCNPPENTRFCPREHVTRGQMAAFLRRALDIPLVTPEMPLAAGTGITCDKAGAACRVTYDVSAGRSYLIEEGHFLVEDATAAENNAFNASNTRFELTINGTSTQLSARSPTTDDGLMFRYWGRSQSFSSGNHTLVASWYWNGQLVQRTTATVRASG